MDRKTMEELVAEQRSERKPMANISRTDETHFSINNHEYELVSDPEQTLMSMNSLIVFNGTQSVRLYCW